MKAIPQLYLHLLSLTLVISGVTFAQEVPPEPKPPQPEAAKRQYLRVSRDDQKQLVSMDTAIVRFVPQAGHKGPKYVDLIGAVHVGEGAYYQKLNEVFEKYDAVLYELVAPEGTRIPKNSKRKGAVTAIGSAQQGMKSMLELEYQLEKIDYTKKNLVHADMSPEEFAKSMEAKDESFSKMFWRMLGQGMAQQQQGKGTSDVNLLIALFSSNRALRLKRIMAQQFEDLEGQMVAIDGPDGSTIISERNKKCFEVLSREIEAGKKRIAIFYGAGHLADMEERLIRDFHMRRKSTRWLEAWKLTK